MSGPWRALNHLVAAVEGIRRSGSCPSCEALVHPSPEGEPDVGHRTDCPLYAELERAAVILLEGDERLVYVVGPDQVVPPPEEETWWERVPGFDREGAMRAWVEVDAWLHREEEPALERLVKDLNDALRPLVPEALEFFMGNPGSCPRSPLGACVYPFDAAHVNQACIFCGRR